MTTYILLRNNKETTPLNLDEVKKLGLKADDLVWVEGQSVCWLNPGQIAELKNVVGLAPEEVLPHPVGETPVKNVFVSLRQKDSQVDAGIKKPIVKESERKWAGYTDSGEEPEPIDTKYSKPLDEIKEIYLKNLEKKNKGFQVPPQLRKAGLYAALVLTGIIAGIMIKKSGAQKESVLSASEIRPVPNEIPQAVDNSAQVADYQESPTEVLTGQQVPEVTVDNRLVENKKPDPGAKTVTQQNLPVNETPEPVTSAAKEIPPTETGEVKDEEKQVRKISMNEVRSQVSVKTNNYDVGSFGGIKNLKLTITNHSKYELDKVGVEVQYLKPLNEFLRSEIVSVQSLSPGETKVIEVKKSSRGVKVNCRISSIKSKDFSDDTAGL